MAITIYNVLTMFNSCSLSHPHWGNRCPTISNYLTQRKAMAAKRRITNEEYAIAAYQTKPRTPESPVDHIQGYDAWPFMVRTHLIQLYLIPGLIPPMLSPETC